MNWIEIFTRKKLPDEKEPVAFSADAGMAAGEKAAPSADGEVGLQAAEAGAEWRSGAAENKTAPVAPEPPLCDVTVRMRINDTGDIAKAALYLALSEGIGEERRIKEALSACGWCGVATEVGGISGELAVKASRALVGAALNSGVVCKSTAEMHALMHAAQEAFNVFIPGGLLEMSIGAKIAIVRNAQWLAVAVAGDAAFHAVAHHGRVGVGVMHL